METALVRLSMPGGVGGQRREPLPTRLEFRLTKKIAETTILLLLETDPFGGILQCIFKVSSHPVYVSLSR